MLARARAYKYIWIDKFFDVVHIFMLNNHMYTYAILE